MDRVPVSLLLVLALGSACASSSVRGAPDPARAGRGAPGPRGRADEGGADAERVAKQLANPVSALISVPLQLNHDRDIGPGAEGVRTSLTVQPVVPFTLDEEWNLISRTILPLVAQRDVPPGEDERGLGDLTQSLFLSPAAPTRNGWILGAGPVLLVPTATDETLGAERWGAGPTGVALRQQGPWTYGALANHVWSFAGDDDRADVSTTFVQPFVAHTSAAAWTLTLNAESTYDWEADELAVPVNAVATKVTRIGGQLVSVGAGLRWWAEESDASPEGLGFRVVLSLLYPR